MGTMGMGLPTNPIGQGQALGALLANDVKALQTRAASLPAEQAAKDFESVFIFQLLEEMKRTIPDSGLLSSGPGKQIKDMFWYYLAQDMAKSGGFGMWKDIYNEMTKLSPTQLDANKPTLEHSS